MFCVQKLNRIPHLAGLLPIGNIGTQNKKTIEKNGNNCIWYAN